MAAIFQIRRGETNISIADGELYLHKGSGSIQFGSGSTPYNLLPLNAPAYGDINLSGSISASGDVRIGGNIYLGNATADNISALGQFTTNLVPTPHNGIDVGTTSAYWRNVYATSISGAIAATNGVISGSAQIAASLPQGVVSGSSQVIGILSSLNSFSASVTSSLDKLYESTASLNSFTASLNTSITNLNSFTESQISKNSTLATYTGSVEGRFTALATISGSLILTASAHEVSITNLNQSTSSANARLNNLESKSASVDVSLTQIHSYTSSLKDAISLNGTNVTINGDLSVLGTTTQINSTQVNIGDNILELNFGGSATEAGIYTKDATGVSEISGSLLWDATNDYWKAGVKNAESKILLAHGDNVISSSLQLIQLNSFTSSTNTRLELIETSTGSLNSFSSSTLIRLGLIETSTGSLNSFSSSTNTRLGLVETSTGSLNQFTESANTRLGLVETSTGSLNLFTQSTNIRLGLVETSTGSLNSFSTSTLTRLTLLETSTGSLNEFSSSTLTRLNLIETSTGSLNEFTSSQITKNTALATITGSLIVSASQSYLSASLMTSSVRDHEERISYLEGIGGISGGNPLTQLHIFSSSAKISIANLEAATSSYETKGSGIWSGSAQLPSGVVSGSIQILGGSGIWSSSTQMPAGVVSGSSQISYPSLSNIPSGIVSGAAQVTPLLPAGVISGSSQVSYPSLSNIPSGIISGAAQLSGTTITNLTITNLTTVNQTSSIVFSSGSNRFGDFGNDTHEFTGSVQISGSITTIGPSTATSFNGIINATNGVISSSAQITTILPTGVVSGSSQIVPLLPTGVISGSVQILGGSGVWSSSVQMPAGVVSGSSQIVYSNISSIPSGIVSGAAQVTPLLPNGVISGSSQISGLSNAQLSNSSITIAGTSVSLGGSITAATILNGTNVISSSTQIVSVLPTGVVSGSSQIDLTATTNYASGILTRLNAVGVVSGSSQISLGSAAGNIALATQTTGDYVASLVQGTGVTITNNSGENATPTIAIGQAVGTSANVQFASIGVGTTASGASGEIRATGDITAYYSSDERLKENIVPIPNALEKVNQISGNTYDWKEGYDEVHSHKGNDVGVIAQEIEAILPQIVTNRDTGFKAVQYEKIIPLLIEAIKELSSKIDSLENK